MKKVVVIGAGAAGLCCARHLSKFPDIFQFKVYEQGDQIGGTWVYNNPTPRQLPRDVRERNAIQHQETIKDDSASHSSIYKVLRSNIPKEIMQFPDFPFDDCLPSFPHHEQILSYLESYSDHYHLKKYINFGMHTEQVTPIPLHCIENQKCNHKENENGYLEPEQVDSVKWNVTTSCHKTGQTQSEECDFVIVCNGHFSIPHVPKLKGLASFPGRVIHSHLYREPEPFTDQVVLIVGTGPSGEELIFDLSPYAKDVYLCNKHDPLVCKLPDNIQDLPGIVKIKPDGIVCFEDGRERYVDSIILATGYLYSYPFLTKESGIIIENGKRVTPLYKHTFNAVHPSIAIIGVYFGVVPFPGFDLQVQSVLSVWRGDKKLPCRDEMLEDIEQTYQERLQEGLPPQLASHFLGSTQWELFRHFAEFSGVKPLDPVVRNLFEASFLSRANNLVEYKNVNYQLIDRENFCVVEN